MNQELKEILLQDRIADRTEQKKYGIFRGGYEKKLCQFKIFLRKAEYYSKQDKKLLRLVGKYYDVRKNRLGGSLGFSIPLYCFGPGLSIPHYGTIIVNSRAKIGSGCVLQACTVIGQNGKSPECPVIGDHVFIGNGAKILGNITIGDHVTIGAGAVVVKDVPSGVVVGGVPAKIIRGPEEPKPIEG